MNLLQLPIFTRNDLLELDRQFHAQWDIHGLAFLRLFYKSGSIWTTISCINGFQPKYGLGFILHGGVQCKWRKKGNGFLNKRKVLVGVSLLQFEEHVFHYNFSLRRVDISKMKCFTLREKKTFAHFIFQNTHPPFDIFSQWLLAVKKN